MKKALAVTVAIVAFHLVLRAAGCAEHAGVLAGMVRSDASYVLGPLYVLSHLFTVILAPILGGAAAVDLALARRR